MCFLTNIHRFFEPSINENFIRIFSNYINKYQGKVKSCLIHAVWRNSITVEENFVYYFLARLYNGSDDVAGTIMSPANCRSSTVIVSTKDNLNLTQPEPVYVYTILSYQIWLEILPCTSHRIRDTIDLTTVSASKKNSPL